MEPRKRLSTTLSSGGAPSFGWVGGKSAYSPSSTDRMRPVSKSRVQKTLSCSMNCFHFYDGNSKDGNVDGEIVVVSQSQSREMSQSLVKTSQGGLPLHRSSSFHKVKKLTRNFELWRQFLTRNQWQFLPDSDERGWVRRRLQQDCWRLFGSRRRQFKGAQVTLIFIVNFFSSLALTVVYIWEHIWKHTEQVKDFAWGKPTDLYPCWCYFCILTCESNVDNIM